MKILKADIEFQLFLWSDNASKGKSNTKKLC